MNDDNKLVIYLLIFLGAATLVFFGYLFIVSCFWLFYVVIANVAVPYTVPLTCSVIISIAHCVYFWVITGDKENE